jgi:hypothetical protein
MSMSKKLAAVAALACAFPLAAQANLISNGDFAIDAVGWTYNNPSDGGYLFNDGNPLGSFWINHNGLNIDAGNPDPMVSQMITTVIGSQYQLFFDQMASAIAGGTGLALDIDGSERATYSGVQRQWFTEQLLFTAAGTSTTIAFRAEINGTDFDYLIDNVRVTLIDPGNGNGVPEPASAALLGMGLLGLAALRRKRG